VLAADGVLTCEEDDRTLNERTADVCHRRRLALLVKTD
jgi:hypothetical protein